MRTPADVHDNKDTPLPLASVRVVDLTRFVAGPHATRILADLGAEVIRVDSIHGYDPMRASNPVPGGEPGSLDRSPLWSNMNRRKRSVSLNLWHPEALEILKGLIAIADVLLENFRPRVMQRWGLTYPEVLPISPDIIYVSLSGFGHTGRHRDYVTFGPTAQALSGMTYMTGLPGCPPAGIGFSYLDHMAGYYAAVAALAALHYRKQSGHSQHIDTSQLEAGVALSGPSILDNVVNQRPYRRPGNPPGNHNTYRTAAPEGVYPCQGEDQWCAITVRTDEEWQGLRKALGEPGWAQQDDFRVPEGRVRHREKLDALLAECTRRFSKYELMELLQSHGVAAGAVQSPSDRAEHDPQLAARGFFWSFQHPEFGNKLTDGLPFRMSPPWPKSVPPPPHINQDNDYVLRDLLEVPAEDRERLAREGAI